MDLFTYLMAKKGHNSSVHGDLFSYLLGKKSGTSGTYTTFTGTTFNISNTIKSAIKNFFLNPSETSQESTTGKNLLNLNLTPIYRSGANASFNEPNIEIIKTVGSTNAFCLFSVGESSILNGKTLLFTGNLLSGQSRAVVGYADANGQNRVTIDGSGIDISSGTFQRSITVDGTTYANKNVVIWLYSDTLNTGDVGDKLTFKDVMVSENGGDYEPYTGGIPAPNPDYPFPIHTVSGENNIKIENKNLFDVEEFEDKLVSGKILNDSGTEISDTGSSYSKYMIFLEANKTYYIKGYFQRIYYFNENKIFKSRSGGTFNLRSFSYTPTENEYLEFQIHNTTWETNKGEEQIEFGSSATSYVSHQEQNYAINLGNLEYCKIGDYKDQIFKNTINSPYYDNNLNENEWYIHKLITKDVFDGTENWEDRPNYTDTDRFVLSGVNWITPPANRTMLSNYFTYEDNTGTHEYPNISTNGSQCIVNFSAKGTTTLAQFKEWLSTHNLIVYAKLNTPQYINITENYPTLATQLENLSKARSYDDETNISQTNNDLPFDMSLDIKVATVGLGLNNMQSINQQTNILNDEQENQIIDDEENIEEVS